MKFTLGIVVLIPIFTNILTVGFSFVNLLIVIVIFFGNMCDFYDE
jgi:uncharacterized membrane protein